MSKPIIVVLAAGMGSRYGGLKQMDKIGKNGEVLLDYSVFDAKRAGFGKAVFIIRHDIEEDFRQLVISRIEKDFPCEIVYQEMDSLIPPDCFAKAKDANRTKPWGTTHALLCARSNCNAPFIVINADDFYGREAFAAAASFFANSRGSDGSSEGCGAGNEGAIVPYRLGKTLSLQGTVARGVCEIKNGYLETVNEMTSIAREADGCIYNTAADGATVKLQDETPVSMNFWGFPVSIFDDLQRYFDSFLEESAHLPKAECFLPLAADWFIKNGLLKIKALQADSPWFGVTYKEDREAAVKQVASFTASGVYPERLWGK
jgi:choline kinase